MELNTEIDSKATKAENLRVGFGAMPAKLRALKALSEDPGLDLSVHIGWFTKEHLWLQLQGIWSPSLTSMGIDTHRYTHTRTRKYIWISCSSIWSCSSSTLPITATVTMYTVITAVTHVMVTRIAISHLFQCTAPTGAQVHDNIYKVGTTECV